MSGGDEIETCNAQNMPNVDQWDLANPEKACVPAAWASLLALTYNAGLVDASPHKMHNNTDLKNANILYGWMKTDALGTTYYNQKKTAEYIVPFIRTGLSAPQELEAGTIGYGSNDVLTSERLRYLLRNKRWGVLQYGKYAVKSTALISGEKIVTYQRQSGHDVVSRGYKLVNGNYRYGFWVKTMDPFRQPGNPIADIQLIKYSDARPGVATAKFWYNGEPVFDSLSTGSAYVVRAEELTQTTDLERILEGMTYLKPFN